MTSEAGISSTEIRKEGQRDVVIVTPIQNTQAAISDLGDLAMNILLAQPPPLSKYSGNSETEMFEEWHEQFQLVATVCKWDNRLKLANLATQLQGQAYSFYCTCSQQQRTPYESLVSALSQRSGQSGSRLYRVFTFTIVTKGHPNKWMIMLKASATCTNKLTHRPTKGARRPKRWDKRF